jgi:hypothetical protein
MTATLSNEGNRPGISQITEAVFSTMLELPIDPAAENERYELTAAVYYAGRGAAHCCSSVRSNRRWSGDRA